MQSVTETINHHVNGWAGLLELSLHVSNSTATLLLTAFIFLSGILLFFVVRPIFLAVCKQAAEKPQAAWIHAAYHNYVFHRMAWLIPGIVVLLSTPFVLDSDLPLVATFARVLIVCSEIYVVMVVAMIVAALLNTIQARFLSFRLAQRYTIKSYIQVLKILLFFITAIVVIAIIIGRSPFYLLTGLGALTAVGMLIFKDSILGFVASIQLSVYDIIRIGDWIEMPKYGADGTVTDISLNTIKVQNFDKTIITIPSFNILTDGVKNWRGMSEAGSRRIKRYITININSIKLCQPAFIEKIKQLPLMNNKVDVYLQSNLHHVDASALKMLDERVAGVTNLTLFRLYLAAYLANHPRVNNNLTLLVRELQDTHYGVPLEIYLFLNTTDWVAYEAIQSDIFDYIYAILPLFELTVFQYQSER